ncbi:MAG: FctA domain-containing protein [Clostridia bacterium]
MIGYFRKRKRVAWIVTLLLSVTILFGMSGTTVSAATGAVADDVTIGHWHDSIAIDDTTKNIGRIWTDKSVSAGNIVMGKLDNSGTKTVEKNGDSDFLVGLSALSSAAKIMGQSTVPLDIVMVLDVSGSMDDDNKMNTLKTAVNSFIDETAKTNSERSNENLRSRISLVKFAGDKTNKVGNDTYRESGYTYNYTQIVRKYKTYTNDNKAELKNMVNALKPAGATAADYAMDHAKTLVNQSKSDETANPNRKNVKRIVIFFTDGEPNHGTGFNESVANTAIQTAKEIKADAKMYSIGVFKDADASITTGGSGFWGGWTDEELFNTYMHGMSSNYPNATAYDNLGTRATNSDGSETAFYKAATQASELNNIFNEIQEEIIATAQSPTEVEGTDPAQSGYVTLVDQLGDYMQVDDLNSLLYAENQYHYTKKDVTKEGNTTKVTYTFEKEIPDTNHVYPTGNLRDIKITVEKADAATALATGDKVTVKIPANLIPLRYYEVTKDNKLTVDDTYPCRLFYDVSLKAAAEKKLERPDEAMEAYIAENSNEDGQVAFYANKYDKKSSNRDSEGIGAYANFTPASTNDFYYFQEDKVLYTDEACTKPAKDAIDTSGDTTYYYQRQYYEKGASGNAVKKTYAVKIPGNSNLLLEGYAKKNTKTGEYYIPAGTPRTTSLTYFTENKADGANKSQTSNRVIKPVWENNYAGKTVYAHLGNNGKLVKELPGELDIRKSVQAAEGHQVPDSLKDQEFEYKLTFTGGTKEKYTAQKYTGADKEGDEFAVKSGDTFKLKDDQTLKIYGVDGGTKYTVTEAKPEHFTGSAAQRNAGEGSETGTNNDGGVYAKGTVAGKDAAVVDYTNIYQADSTTLKGSESLKIKKNFETASGASAWDMDYLKDAKFQFILSPQDNECPMPKDAAVVDGMKVSRLNVNSKAEIEKAFGDIEYTKPGTYEYQITEKDPGDTAKQGVTYSNASYRVTVKVTDENGSLKANATMKKIRKDDGSEVANPTAVDNKAVFKNKYESSLVYGTTGALNIQKVLNGRTMKAGEFEFTYGPKDGQTAKITNPNQRGSGEPDTMNVLADLTFDQTMSGKTQTYIVRETKGSIKGVTYDERIGTVEITPQDNGDGTMHVVTKVTMKNADGSGESVKTYDSSNHNSGTPTVRFTNTYAAAATDPVQVITGFNKKLTGREWKDGETFTFKLKNVSKPDGVETAPMPEKDEVTLRKADVKDGKAPIEFGALTFKKAGEYKYQLKEQVPSPEAAGMTYDKAVRDITVTVTDNGTGKLTAAVTAVSGNKTFTNEYKTEDLLMDQVLGLSMTKVLTGRDMTEDDFSFTLKGADEASAKKLNIAEDGATVPGKAGADGETVTVRSGLNMTLKQADIGKTYAYTFEEVKGSAKGIVYDESQYKLEITAKDGGDGTLKAEVVLKDKAGKELFRKTVSNENPAMGEKGITLAFANRYDGSTDVSGGTKADINASKKLTGRKLKAGEFTFELMTKPGDGSEGTVLQTKKNGADGSIHFDALSYRTNEKAAGSGTVLKKAVEDGYATKTTKDGKVVYTVNYRVAESANNLPKGVTVTAGSFDLSVEVTDNNDGTLTAKTIYPKDSGDKCEFVNTYGTGEAVPVNVSGSKTLEAEEGLNPPDISGKFTFTLKALTEGAPMPKDAPKDATVTNDGNGNVTFGTLAFNIDNLEDVDQADDGSREKTFKYSVTESGSVPGVVNDSKNTKEFELTLKDDGEGHLSVSRKPETDNLFAFTNTYRVEELSSSVTDQIDITKKLDGRNLKDGEFKFRLMEDGKVISEAANDANGKVTFDKITYTKPGSHTYTVCEENDGKGGVIYDSNSYTVYTLVVDNGNGKLEATHRIDKEISGDQPAAKDIAFANKYQAKPTEVSLSVTKRLNNAKLKSGQFTFELKDANGEEVERAKNKADGSVQFKTLGFETAGTYEYTIEELNDKQKGITYDTKVYHVTIKVTDNGEGSLKAELTGDKAVFSNSYDKGDNGGGDDDGKTPVVTPTGIQTGDYTSGFMGMVVLFLSACVSLAVTLRKKRA